MAKPTAKKTVLITGCSEGGIGYHLALAFLKRGHHVFACVRKTSKLGSLSANPNVTPITLDVNSPASIAAAVSTVEAHTAGTLDCLINNAGVSYTMPVLDMSLEIARDMFETNVWAPLALIQAFAPLVVKARGTIVNNGSLVANMDAPFMAAYSASKSALVVLSRILRLEMEPLGVKVLTLITGGVRTNIMSSVPNVELPKTSFYRPVEDAIRKAATEQPAQVSEPEVYARNVVADILGGKESRYGMIYRGFASTVSRWMPNIMPVRVVDYMMTNSMGLERMKI